MCFTQHFWNFIVDSFTFWISLTCLLRWESLWLHLHWHKKHFVLFTSDTDQNLLHTCKHKNQSEIRFFRIRSEPLPNVDFNRIHIRYLDIRPTSKHTYPILHRTPNARATRLLIKIFNGVLMPACCMRILLRWKLFIGKKLHIQELVFNPCPVNFENTTAKSYIIFLSNEVIS